MKGFFLLQSELYWHQFLLKFDECQYNTILIRNIYTMRNVILFDDDNWNGLLPLSFTRPVCEIRVGILTIREKWEKVLDARCSYITQDFLSQKYAIRIADDNIIINSTVLPTAKLKSLINSLEPNEAILMKDELIAARLDRKQFDQLIEDDNIDEIRGLDISEEEDVVERILRPHDVFTLNHKELAKDYELITKGRKSEALHESNTLIGDTSQLFIEEGAEIYCSTLNTTKGPIYIGRNAEIMEGCHIRGGLAMCNNAVLKLGAKIYGATTLGPYSKVGGEVSNVVFLGYCSKGHDGYLGNAVIGEWCNLGADTNSSNLKNNYAEVRNWSYVNNRFESTGLQFCGLIMGDHSKCGINTMFNTGTVVGVSANIFGDGFPRNFIPSYSWGGSSGFKTYNIDKAIEVAHVVMGRRSLVLSQEDEKILRYIHLHTAHRRTS